MTRLAFVGRGLVGCVLTAGCLPEPEVGAPLTPNDAPVVGCTSNSDSDPAMDVSYSTDLVDGVFVRGRCISCHISGGRGVVESGLRMTSYRSLRNGGRHSGASIVVPGAPCSSVLVLKIEPSPPFGQQMPYNGPPYLSADDIQLVSDWVAEGARDN